jgi:hypothetical protein
MSFQTETGTERNEMTENQSIQCSIDSLTQSILSMLSIETKKEQFLALTVSLSLDLLSFGVIYDNNTTSNTVVKIHQSEKYQMKCLLKGTEKTKEEEKEKKERQ